MSETPPIQGWAVGNGRARKFHFFRPSPRVDTVLFSLCGKHYWSTRAHDFQTWVPEFLEPPAPYMRPRLCRVCQIASIPRDCPNCEHFNDPDCHHPRGIVSGQEKDSATLARDVRERGSCGLDAVLFWPKLGDVR